MTDPVENHSSLADAARKALGALVLQVAPENLLHVSHALRAESILLDNKFRAAKLQAVVGEPGLDRVSSEAAPRFNAKIATALEQCEAYVRNLEDTADQMEASARRYGHSEQEIAASFNRYQAQFPVPERPL